MLTPGERDKVRSWLRRDRELALREASRAIRAADELRRRAGARDPCAYLGAAARSEDEALARELRAAREGEERVRRIKAALRRLDDEQEAFGACHACHASISMERFEVVPDTQVCRECAAGR